MPGFPLADMARLHALDCLVFRPVAWVEEGYLFDDQTTACPQREKSKRVAG